MSDWLRGRPSAIGRQAIVYVDFDNLAIQEERPWTPGLTIDKMLDQVQALVRQIADDPGIYIFVNVHSDHPRARREELERACEARNMIIIHQPTLNGKDQVDEGIIREWYRQHRSLPLEVPFVLISLDRGFEEMLVTVKEAGRPVYLGMPTHNFFPPHALALTGSAWLDSRADEYRAMCFLLSESGSRLTPQFEAKFAIKYRAYRRWQAAIRLLAKSLQSNSRRRFAQDSDELENFIVTAAKGLGFDLEEAERLLPYLVFYRVLIPDGRDLVVNSEHPIMKSASAEGLSCDPIPA